MARAGAQAAAESPQELTHGDRWRMSALPPKADIDRHDWHVRFVPKADFRIAAIGISIRSLRQRAARAIVPWPRCLAHSDRLPSRPPLVRVPETPPDLPLQMLWPLAFDHRSHFIRPPAYTCGGALDRPAS